MAIPTAGSANRAMSSTASTRWLGSMPLSPTAVRTMAETASRTGMQSASRGAREAGGEQDQAEHAAQPATRNRQTAGSTQHRRAGRVPGPVEVLGGRHSDDDLEGVGVAEERREMSRRRDPDAYASSSEQVRHARQPATRRSRPSSVSQRRGLEPGGVRRDEVEEDVGVLIGIGEVEEDQRPDREQHRSEDHARRTAIRLRRRESASCVPGRAARFRPPVTPRGPWAHGPPSRVRPRAAARRGHGADERRRGGGRARVGRRAEGGAGGSGQPGGAGIPVVGVLGHAAGHHLVEPGRDGRPQP